MGLPLYLFYSERLLLYIFSRGLYILFFDQIALIHVLRLPQANRQLLGGLLSNHLLHAHPHSLGLLRLPVIFLL